jgi:hypothetical protein
MKSTIELGSNEKFTLADASFVKPGTIFDLTNKQTQSTELVGFGPIKPGETRIVISNGKRWRRSRWREWCARFRIER